MVTTQTLVEVDFLRRRVVHLEWALRRLLDPLEQLENCRTLEQSRKYLDDLAKRRKAARKILEEVNVTENLRQAGVGLPEPDGGDDR